MKKLLAMCLLLLGCNSQIKTNDSKQEVVQSGESYTYIVVRLEFIEEMKKLCQESLLVEDYANTALYNQAVAQCTFDKFTILNVNPTEITTFISTYCQPTSDLSALTPSELASVTSACAALGVPRP